VLDIDFAEFTFCDIFGKEVVSKLNICSLQYCISTQKILQCLNLQCGKSLTSQAPYKML